MINGIKIQVYISKQKEEKQNTSIDKTLFLKDRLYLEFITLYYKQGKFNLVKNI